MRTTIIHSIFRFIIVEFFLVSLLFGGTFKTNAQLLSNDSLTSKYHALRAKPDFEKDTLYIDLLYQLGRQNGMYNLDSLLVLANETIALSEAINYDKGKTQGLINKGYYYAEIGNHEMAIKFNSRALDKAMKIEDIDLILRAKNLLAIEFEYMDEYTKALREYLEGIELAKENNSLEFLSTFYVNTSNLYGVQKETKKSIYFLELAKENNKQIDNKRYAGVTLANLAANYIDINELNTAEKYADECIAIFDKINLESWLVYAYELKATVLYKRNNLEEALKWFKKSEKIHETIAQTRYKIPLFNGMAKVYFDLKDYEKSEAYARNSYEISKNLNLLEQRDISLQLLYKIKKATNKPKMALNYLEELKTLSDTLYIKKNEKELRILKSNLEFDQEKERYVLENEKKVSKQKSYLYGAISIILMFSIIIFILRRNNKVQDELNKELTQKEIYLNTANNTKSRLFSIIAHDLKGPVNSVNSVFDLLDSENIELEEFQEMAPLLKKNMNAVSSILNNLLSWGQSQMNELITKPEITQMHSLVDQNITLLLKTAVQKSISMINEVGQEVLTWSDKNQIDIVIRNLLSNAIKFTPNDGEITIGAKDKQTHWEFYVRDTGVGMSQDAVNKIFGTHETFSTYGTNNEKGTGLGLVLCKEMIENNEGTIWVESKKGEGTSFYFTQPKKSDSNEKTTTQIETGHSI